MGGMISILLCGGYPIGSPNWYSTTSGPDIDPGDRAHRRLRRRIADRVQRYERSCGLLSRHYPAMRNIPDAQLVEQVKWSVKPAANGKLTWKMDPQIRKPVRGGLRRARPTCGCPSRASRRRYWWCAAPRATSSRPHGRANEIGGAKCRIGGSSGRRPRANPDGTRGARRNHKLPRRLGFATNRFPRRVALAIWRPSSAVLAPGLRESRAARVRCYADFC